jgi:hypothetical protein
MLIAVLRRYVTNPRWFIWLTVTILLADILIALFIGDRLVRWEINYIRDSW